MFTRRAFLKSGSLAVCSLSIGGNPLLLNSAAQATSGKRRILVALFQRGAMDGLMAVSPINDPWLKKMRPRLAIFAGRREGANALIDLDGKFGLHPALAPFAPFYKEGRLAVVHGVGSPNPTRSHFDAQDYMETGTPGRKGTSSGWLNRACGLMGHEATPFRAVSMTPTLPRSFYGYEPALAISNLDDFGVPGSGGVARAVGESFESLYEQTSEQLLRNTGRESFEAIRLLSKKELRGYLPADGAEYPRSPLGNALKQIAQLIKAEVGLEIAFAETMGWDTHVQQGTGNGTFAQRARDLSGSIAAFWKDVELHHDRVVLMTMTEFGRTVHENGSGGTDHGRASCLFVLGNQVDGGKVHGRIPELDPDALQDGRDLPVTTDFRAVFSGVMSKHLGVGKNQTLFPGWTGDPVELMKS